MAFTVLWRRQTTLAAILSPILGLLTGLAVWLGCAYRFGGSVTVATTGEVLPCVYGTVASAFSPIAYSVILTFALGNPQAYDWARFKNERLALGKIDADSSSASPSDQEESNAENTHPSKDNELKRWARIATFWSVATFLGHWVIWPLPMYGSHYVFGRKVCFVLFLLSLKDNVSVLMIKVLYRVGGCCHYMAVADAAHGHLLSSHRRWDRADWAGV
jgi:hypothetical protein